jgi:hypothetical protein
MAVAKGAARLAAATHTHTHTHLLQLFELVGIALLLVLAEQAARTSHFLTTTGVVVRQRVLVLATRQTIDRNATRDRAIKQRQIEQQKKKKKKTASGGAARRKTASAGRCNTA